jgi:hypothetical protein
MTVNDSSPAVTTDPPEQALDPENTRTVARLYLTRMSPDWLRADVATGRHEPLFAGMFLAIADEMDALLAGGFDVAAFAESLKSGDGAPASVVPAQSPAEEG